MFKNFDFSWFLTTPGILTGLGCLLILISIIIFISSLKGSKGKEKPISKNAEVIPEVKESEAVIQQETTPVSVEPAVTPVEATPVSIEPTVAPAETTPVSVEPAVAPAETTPVSIEPTVAPVEITPVSVEPTVAPVETTPVSIEPTVTPVETTPVSVEPTVAPVEITPIKQVDSSLTSTDQNQLNNDVITTFTGIDIEPTIQSINKPDNANEIKSEIGTDFSHNVENSEIKNDDIESL